MRLEEIRCRDPFIVQESGLWYLFRSHDGQAPEEREGVDVFCSADGEEWAPPAPALALPNRGNAYWAPEAHQWNGNWYLLVTVTGPRQGCGITTPLGREKIRGTCVFRSDRVAGPYSPWSHGPVTPWEQLALDGTLYISPAREPYIIYCHEWLQTVDGTVEAVPLSEDLRERTGESAVLFRASDAPWCQGQYVEEAEGIHFGCDVRVTDGVFPFRDLSGALCLLWSTANRGRYQTGFARSPCGLWGPWEHPRCTLYEEDGGHAMLLTEAGASGAMVLHQPNTAPLERVRRIPVQITSTGITIQKRG